MSDDVLNAALVLRRRLELRRDHLRKHLRDLELDAVLVRGRSDEVLEQLAALDELLDDSPRRAKQRKITVINLPQRQDNDPDSAA
jgi:hypothetical protein